MGETTRRSPDASVGGSVNVEQAWNRRLLSAFTQDERVRRGLSWGLVASVIGRSSGLLSSIVLARLLGSEGYGQLGILQNTILTFGILAGFGAGLTATKHVAETFRSEPLRAGRLLALSHLLALGFGLFTTLLVFAGAPFVATGLLHSPSLQWPLQVAALGLLPAALNGAQLGALSGFEAFREVSRVNLVTGGLNLLCMTVGVFLGGVSGAIWGSVCAGLLCCLYGSLCLRRVAAAAGIRADYRRSWEERAVLWTFSLPSMLANTLVGPASWACNVLLVQSAGFSEVAAYNVATQWRQLLLFLPSIVSQVFLPVLASAQGSKDWGTTARLHRRVNAWVGVPALVLLALASPLILGLYGSSYRGHWPAFVVVQMATLAQILQGPAITAWTAAGKMWTNFFANAFWGSALLGLSWWFLDLGALGLALALLSSFLFYFLVIAAVDLRR